jgi:nicotinate-nucleotide adenylyltransferase
MPSSNVKLKRIGVMGGTFDPVHIGHTELAQEALQRLELDELYLMPCKLHPQNKLPSASPSQRLEMLELALTDYPQLAVDSRELQLDAVSYTAESLRDIRQTYGDNVILCFLLGVDAFASLTTWHQWERLLKLANLVVLERAGYDSGEAVTSPVLQAMLADAVEYIVTVSGSVQRLQLTPFDLSSTQIRAELAELDYEILEHHMNGEAKSSQLRWEERLSPKVSKFIVKNGLYGLEAID